LILPEIESQRLYMGKGGDIIREAVCLLIESISKSHLQLPEFTEVANRFGKIMKRKTTAIYRESIEENLKNPKENISQMAVDAFKAFCEEYYPEKIESFADRYVKMLQTDKNPAVKRGMSLAISVIPRHLMIPRLNDIIEILCKRIEVEVCDLFIDHFSKEESF
jgi:tubulin-specific chaperone D